MIKTKNKTWTAYYAPAGHQDITKFGFSTKKKAIEYAKKFACKLCLKEKYFEGSMCGCEWLFIKEEDFKKAKNHEDLMKAAGYKEVTKEELKIIFTKKEIKRTFYEWYRELFTINSAFCVSEPAEKDKNKKITRKEFEKYKK